MTQAESVDSLGVLKPFLFLSAIHGGDPLAWACGLGNDSQLPPTEMPSKWGHCGSQNTPSPPSGPWVTCSGTA